jgi:hypothetical protein
MSAKQIYGKTLSAGAVVLIVSASIGLSATEPDDAHAAEVDCRGYIDFSNSDGDQGVPVGMYHMQVGGPHPEDQYPNGNWTYDSSSEDLDGVGHEQLIAGSYWIGHAPC